MIKRHVSRIIAALLCISATGCAFKQDFANRSVLQQGVIGKSWSTTQYLEPSVDSPDVNSASRTFNGFDLAGNSTQAQLAASFYDNTSGRFIGYGRLYDHLTGWSSVGSNFAAIAAGGGSDSLDFTALAANAGGLFSAFFFSSATTNATLTDVSFSTYSGAWDYNSPKDMTLTPVAFDSSNFNTIVQYPVATAFDGVGRAYAVFRDTSDDVRMIILNRAIGVTPSGTTLSGASSTSQQVVLKYDGVSQMCAFFLVTNSGVDTPQARCLNTATNVFSAAVDLATSQSSSIAAASDGRGNIMVVFVQAGHIYATLGNSGAFGDGVQIDDAPLPPVDDGSNTSVGVSHLGGGYYLAVWLGQSGTAGQIYSSLYSPISGAWSSNAAASSIVNNGVSYAFSSLNVDGNGNSNGGYAVRVNNGALHVMAARFQGNVGWLTPTVGGNGCTVSTTSPCNHRPASAIFSDGTTVVVFPDQDPSGRFRVGAIEFK